MHERCLLVELWVLLQVRVLNLARSNFDLIVGCVHRLFIVRLIDETSALTRVDHQIHVVGGLQLANLQDQLVQHARGRDEGHHDRVIAAKLLDKLGVSQIFHFFDFWLGDSWNNDAVPTSR